MHVYVEHPILLPSKSFNKSNLLGYQCEILKD